MKEQQPFEINMEHAAFIIVDMQNDFVRKNAPLCVDDAVNTIAPIQKIIKVFRESSRPIIFTRFVAGPEETLLWKWSPQIYAPSNCCKIGFSRYYEDIQTERECIAVIDELAPEPADYQVDKFGYGAFFRTNLYDILLAEKVNMVVISGTVTQICVEKQREKPFITV